MSEQKTVVRIDADISSFEKNMSKVTSALQNIGDKFSDIGKNLTAKVTVPLVAMGTGIVKVAGDFEAGMSKVQAISGATGEELAQLREQAKALGAESVFSASETAEGMKNLASAGFEVKEIMSAMPGMLNLAASGDIDLATASDIASSALRGFGLEASEALHVADVLAKTSSSTNAEIYDLGEAMKYIAPVAKSLGISIEDTASAIGTLSNAGIKGSMAGTTLRSALSNLASPTDSAVAVMEELGISVFDTTGKMKPLGDVIGILQTKMSGLTQQEKAHAMETLFGKEAMSGMLALVEQGQESFDALSDSLVKADGASKQMADTMQNNFKGKLEELKGSLETLAINLGEILLPVAEKVVTGLNIMVDKFSALPKSTQGFILAIAGISAIIPPLLILVGSMITAFTTLSTAFATASTTIKAFQIASLANPIGIAIASIVALGAAFIGLYKTNEDFRNKVNGVWNEIKGLAMSIFGSLKEFWATWGDDVKAVFQGLWDAISVILNLLVDAFQVVFPIIASVVKVAIQNTVNILGGLIQTLRGIIDFIAGVFTGDFERAWSGITNIFGGIWNTMTAIVQNAIGTITGLIGGIVESVKRALEWIGKLFSAKDKNITVTQSVKTDKTDTYKQTNKDGDTPRYQNPKWFAKGGFFNKPSIIGVGEAGEEAVVPLTNPNMKPFAEEIGKWLGGITGGVNQTVNIYSPTELNPSDIKQKTLEANRSLAVGMGLI